MTALLTDNLPLLAGAPNGIKKLRELILELAVRGKLVPQDPSDEPASELLKRIAEEKGRLVAEGKIKKQKPLVEVDEQAQPFELPVDWVWTRLGEITNFGTTTKKDEIPDDAWVLDLEDIEKDTSRLLQKTRFYERNSLSDKNSFTKGDVLYGKLRPYLNKVLVAEDDGFCTTEILPFRCHGPFVAHYFMIALKSPYFLSYVNAKSYGMKMPRLGTEDGRQAFFPLPPLAEQHRIVAKVDELMALCDRLEAQQADAESAHAQLVQALLDSLTQASDATDFAANWQRLAEHFHTLFTTEPSIDALKQTLLQLAVMGKLVPQDPNDESPTKYLDLIASSKEKLLQARRVKYRAVTESAEIQALKYEIPATWLWMPFRDAVFFQEGPGIRNWQFKSEGVKLLNVSNIGFDDRLDLMSSDKHVSHDEFNQKYQHFLIEEGDLLFAGSGASWGKVAWYEDPGYPVILNTSTMRLCFFCSKFSANYLFYFTKSNFFREQLVPQLAGLQPNFGSTHLSRIYIPVPPIAEQHRIVAKLDQLMALCDQLKTRLTQARQLNEQLASTLVEQATN